MLKNLILYRIESELPTIEALASAMESLQFQPCGPTQQISVGWVPPRKEGGAMVEAVGDHWITRVMTEARSVPSSMVAREADKAAGKIEEATGRKPGRKQMREIKDKVLLSLLPRAFPRQSPMNVWIDTKTGILAIEAASSSRADLVITALVAAWPTIHLRPLATNKTPRAMLSWWLISGDAPESFSVDRDCELKSEDESKSVVRYARHALDTEEVRKHIAAGKCPTKVALTYAGRVSFVLTESAALKRIEILDVVAEERGKEEQADAFDADVAITAGELRPAIADLIEALGGEVVPGGNAQETGEVTSPRDKALTTYGDAPDPMLDQARTIVLQHKRASISLVQRHLRIGYNRAASLLEDLEAQGVVSPMRNDGGREILITT